MEIKTKIARIDNFTTKPRELSNIDYLVLHYTGNRGDTAKNNAAYFAREIAGTSAHYFVDEQEIWRSVSDDHTAWHCGTKGTYYHPKCRNANSIGVEVCMLDKHGRLRQGSIDRAAALVRELVQRYGIPADRVVRHYDVTHKDCPAPMVSSPALWREFKEQLQEDNMDHTKFKQLWDEMRKELQDNDAGTWSAEARQWAIHNGLIVGNGTTPDGQPNYMWGDLLTREQAVTLMFRLAQMANLV